MPLSQARTITLAKIACAFSGLVWGLFWIPLRALDHAGISGLWSSLVFYAIPFILVLPAMAWRWRETIHGGSYLQILAIVSALGSVLYSISVLYTDVVRAMLLFYLTPIWSTLLARVFLGEAITPARLLALAMGIGGMLVIFKLDLGLPWPDQFGDWLALAAGILWAITALMLRARQDSEPLELWTQNFIWCGLVAFAFVLMFPPATSAPTLGQVAVHLWWLVPTIVIVVMTGVYAAMWGAPKLSPGLVGLLFMTEISIGAITAAIWSGDPFGWREAIGVALITAAALVESLWSLRERAEARA